MDAMELLKALRTCNDVPILSVEDEAFTSFGRVLFGYDFRELCDYMEKNTIIPAEGNVYACLGGGEEHFAVGREVRAGVYGGMAIQIGYCNGKNSTYNGFEYHKGSEINVAVTDLMLVLGHTYDIKNNSYDVSQASVFLCRRDGNRDVSDDAAPFPASCLRRRVQRDRDFTAGHEHTT